MPPARFEPDNRGGAATIGKAVKISGNIYSREDLYVDGDLEGTVEATEHKLTVGPNGTVKATIKAREVVVLGAIHGNVEATDKIENRRTLNSPAIYAPRTYHRGRRVLRVKYRYRQAEPKPAPKPVQQPAAAAERRLLPVQPPRPSRSTISRGRSDVSTAAGSVRGQRSGRTVFLHRRPLYPSLALRRAGSDWVSSRPAAA
jgi:hypothetical protein